MESVVVALAAVLRVLEHVAERRTDTGVAVIVCRVAPKVRVGEGSEVMWRAELRHAVRDWCGKRRAGI